MIQCLIPTNNKEEVFWSWVHAVKSLLDISRVLCLQGVFECFWVCRVSLEHVLSSCLHNLNLLFIQILQQQKNCFKSVWLKTKKSDNYSKFLKYNILSSVEKVAQTHSWVCHRCSMWSEKRIRATVHMKTWFFISDVFRNFIFYWLFFNLEFCEKSQFWILGQKIFSCFTSGPNFNICFQNWVEWK